MKKLPALLLLFCCACVDIPKEGVPATVTTLPIESPYQGLDPGYKTEETAHFSVKAYSSASAALYAGLCEENYTRIMQDLGLYSFVPARPYNVVIYRDAAEYHKKTGQPEWSAGAAYGNALLLFEGEGLKATIGHEMTHLVFNEFMGLSQSAGLRWLNEGGRLRKPLQPGLRRLYTTACAATWAQPIPFSQMVIWSAERKPAQRGPLVRAGRLRDRLYDRQGSSFSFSIFLGKLRDGAAVDKALEDTYGGLWKKLADLEKAWKLEVQR